MVLEILLVEHLSGKSKVTNFEVDFFVDQDIRGLEVSVHQTGGVEEINAAN